MASAPTVNLRWNNPLLYPSPPNENHIHIPFHPFKIRRSFGKLRAKCFFISNIRGDDASITHLASNTEAPINSKIDQNPVEFVVQTILQALKAIQKPAAAAVLVGLLLMYDPGHAIAASGGRMGGSSFSSRSSMSSSRSYSAPRMAGSGFSYSVPYYAPSPFSGVYVGPAVGFGSGFFPIMLAVAAFVLVSGFLTGGSESSVLTDTEKTTVVKVQMAAAYSNLAGCIASIPKLLPSTALFPTSLFRSRTCGIDRIISTSRCQAKFEEFQENIKDDDLQQLLIQESQDAEEEDDSCLPSDLEGAVQQSGQASAEFVSSGGTRSIVELLIPQLQFLDDEGAQIELWDLSKIFLDTLIEQTGCQRVKAIFPDAGAAALLKYKWKDAKFGFSSLGDRKPVDNEDEIVVMVVPDYQMLEYVLRIAADITNDLPRPLIMWNPRLISEDVGVGINVRRLRRDFLSTFTVVYSMKPLPSGAMFRCYPGLWKVFFDDKDRPNRYLLAKEQISRPDIEDLEIIFGGGEDKPEKGTSLFDQAAGIFSSINRFMKVISR